MIIPYLPFDVLNIILQYYGRIKYSHKNCIYVNIIHKNDYRYNIIYQKINNKLTLIKHFNIANNGLKFYIDIYYKNYELGLIFSKKSLNYSEET
jgi:dTDP-D-glucose 4,6-dehydratase